MFVRVAQRRARTVVHRPVKLRVPHHAKPRLLPLLVRSLATQATASQTTTAGAAGQQQSASSASQASKVTLTQSTSNALPQVTISESAKKVLVFEAKKSNTRIFERRVGEGGLGDWPNVLL